MSKRVLCQQQPKLKMLAIVWTLWPLFFPGRSTITCVLLAFWRVLVNWALKGSSCLWCVCCWRRRWWRALYPTCVTAHWNTSSTHCANMLRDVPCSASLSATTSHPRTSSGFHPRRSAFRLLDPQWWRQEKMRWWRGVWAKPGHLERAEMTWRERWMTWMGGRVESGKQQKGQWSYRRLGEG